MRRAASPIRPVVLLACIVAGAAVAGALVVVFPNLRGNPGFLALALLTPPLIAASVGLLASGQYRALGRAATLALGGALAAVVVADLVIFAGPLVNRGATGRATAPEFVASAPTATSGAVVSVATATAAPTQPAAPAPRSGAFDHRPAFDTVSGTAVLGTTADGSLVLRLQGIEATNGPDLHVYLSRQASPATDAQVRDGLEVGRLTAPHGDVNYTLPAGTDPSQYASVVIYCKSFSVVFGYANLG